MSKLNRLCYLEDWEIGETREALTAISKLHTGGFIHRKDWEWARGIIAMKRFDKLKKESLAIGIGTGTEPISFFLANKIKHVFATDLYGMNEEWLQAAPIEFLRNPEIYSPFPYKKDALSVMLMDGTKLAFADDIFDIAYSFSSIEHFPGKGHTGALASMREIERVLKPGGLAVITTEYILNYKNHYEFFNKRTIYTDLIEKLEWLQLTEPLDLRTSTRSLNCEIDFFTIDMNWNNLDLNYKRQHPVVLVRARNILYSSMMLVFTKIE